MAQLGADHFLSLPRPDVLVGPPAGVVDTTTLAAHDFDVDTRTGFMPPQVPLRRLPPDWEAWESVLDGAISQKLTLGDTPDISPAAKECSERWRAQVRSLPVLPIEEMKLSEVVLRRAHVVLAWIMHFYVHSLPPTEPVNIPPPVTLPLLQVSAQLQIPPVITYSDDVLYNWHLGANPGADDLPTAEALQCTTSFTSTTDEAEFYLASARLELVGADALELMQATMDEAFVGDIIAVRRITGFLHQLAAVIDRLREMLLSVKQGCKPDTFYHDIRPWFRGQDSVSDRKWIFEGIEQDPTLVHPTELSGPSAGQSSLIHAIDIFLGVDKYAAHGKNVGGDAQPQSDAEVKAARHAALLKRMQIYMPRHHRAFLEHLSQNPRPLRDLVAAASASEENKAEGKAFLEAYNAAVMAMKQFRDAHMIIVTLYIIGPARRGRVGTQGSALSEHLAKTPLEDGLSGNSAQKAPLKGTGGTDLIQFLKGIRDQTKGAIM